MVRASHEPDPADVNAVSDGGETALHLAALNGVGQLVQLLLERGAKADAVTHVGRQTALHYAVLCVTWHARLHWARQEWD